MPPTYQGQAFTHALNVLKGWPQPYALDIDGYLSASVNIGSINTPPVAGLCVSVSAFQTKTSNGVATGPNDVQFQMGANLSAMPCFLWPNYMDFDVQNPGVLPGIPLGGNSSNVPGWVPVMPAGKLVALVASGPYEIETTEFDTTQTYAPNDYLRAVTSNTDANAGRLTNQNCATNQSFTGGTGKCVWGIPNVSAWDSVVGIVSRGAYTNALGVSVLAFWPTHKPGSR